MLAALAGGLGFVAAGLGAREGDAAEENDCADDGTDGLHVFTFLAA